MPEPSVKGTLYQNMCALILDLRGAGRLSDEEIEKALSSEERALLDAEISIASWYPLDAYCRMLELAASTGPDGPVAFAEQSGHASAEQVISMGLYSQLDGRTEETWEARVARILSTLWGAFFNVGSAACSNVEGNLFEIETTGVRCMPDLLTARVQGFIECLARRAAASNRVVVRAERSPDGDTVTYRGLRSGDAAGDTEGEVSSDGVGVGASVGASKAATD